MKYKIRSGINKNHSQFRLHLSKIYCDLFLDLVFVQQYNVCSYSLVAILINT